jgi:hypothetical protein
MQKEANKLRITYDENFISKRDMIKRFSFLRDTEEETKIAFCRNFLESLNNHLATYSTSFVICLKQEVKDFFD